MVYIVRKISTAMITPTHHTMLALLTIILLGQGAHATFRRWVPNTNFENPHNWDLDRLPCASDVVKFPETVPPVYVQTNITVHELVLPLNGELVLSHYTSFAFSSDGIDVTSGTPCQGGDIIFKKIVAESWFDPENWCEISDPEGTCMAQPSPCLDTECIPCKTDHAVFPNDATFNVDLSSGVDVFLGRLTLRRKEYTTGSFRNYVNSATGGSREFVRSGDGGRTNINIAGTLCQDMTSCPCGNDGGVVEEKICSIQASRCPETYCDSPWQPVGHCCSVCGHIITMDFGSGFKFKSVERSVRKMVPRESREALVVYVSRLHDDQVQVVIQELNSTDDDAATSLMNDIVTKFQPDPSGNTNRYKITAISTKSSRSTAPSNPQAVTGKKGTMSPGSIASVVMAIIGVLFIVALAMYCLMEKRHSDHRPKLNIPVVRWPFGRFSSQEDHSSLELASTIDYSKNVAMYGVEELRGFDNPTYDTAAATRSEVGDSNGIHSPISTIDLAAPATFLSAGGQAGFTNPLYGADMPKIEDLYVDSTLKMNPVFSEENVEDDSQI